MTQSTAQAHLSAAQHIETLLQELDEITDPRARTTVEELLRTLLDLYGAGLERMLTVINHSEHSGPDLIDELAQDDLVASLLLLHGLHPLPLESRIMNALDTVRPSLKAHGGNIEFIGIDEGVAHLRLTGNCHGCSSSTTKLKVSIEEAINKAAPDLEGLQVETAAPPRAGVPVTFVPTKRRKASS